MITLLEDVSSLVNIKDRTWSYNEIEYWKNPADNTVNALIDYDNVKTRLRAGILIIKDDTILLGEEAGSEGEFSLPGGGLEENETPCDAASREAKEEVYINVKNVIDTGYDYCECHTEVLPWVKNNVPKNKWWYNYYTCLTIGEYDSDYLGQVDEPDKDVAMKSSCRWYKIEEVIYRPTFKRQWRQALIDFGYYKPSTLIEQLENVEIDNKYLYHATYKQFLNSIKKSGLGNTHNKMWADSKGKGVVYLAAEPEIAYSYAETAEFLDELDNAEEFTDNIIVLKIEVDQLNRNKIFFDENVLDSDSGTVEYHGIIPYIAVTDIVNESGESIKNESISNILIEDTRSQLVSKSRRVGEYKLDRSRGKNRFERKKYSKVANQVKAYNQIDMNNVFKKDLLEVKIPVTGETDNYHVIIRLNGVVAEIAKNIKNNQNKLEYRTIIQALTRIFNTTNIYVKCDCPDFKYRFEHWSVVNNYGVTDSAHDPGPGRGIVNPNDDKGRGCKHVLLVLANQDWLMKVASVIHNYINYSQENMMKAFQRVIFPKLYGMSIEDAVEKDLLPEDVDLDSETKIIDVINDWAKNRGKIKSGTNVNPVTGTGGRSKATKKQTIEAENDEEDTSKVDSNED